MRNKFTTACIAFFLVVGGATVKANQQASDSTEVFTAQPKFLKIAMDTVQVPIRQVPVVSYENIYHERLSSIQKEVPLTYNEVVQSFINIYLGRKEQMGKMVGLSEYYFPIFEKALRSKGIPEEIKYLSIVESALDPHAVSHVGATGPWQFMFSSAKAFGLTIDNFVDERKDPIAASYAAANYFRDAYNEFGDWQLALAAYNCGKGNVNRAIQLAGGVTDFWAIRQYLPKETRNYVPAFIATTYVMNYYRNHNIARRPANLPLYTDTVGVNKYVSLASVSRATRLNLKQLTTLNPSYKRQVINGTPENPKRLTIPQIDRNAYNSLYNALNLIQEDPALAVFAGNSEEDLSNPTSHKVKPGETLASIANYYRIEVQDLKVWNKLPALAVVPGQTLRLAPEKTFVTYKVQPGDTLFTISKKFRGTSVVEIEQANGLKGQNLKPGMLLKISQG